MDKVVLNEVCSAYVLNKLLPTKHDPGSFTLPSTIGPLSNMNALVDLGASINLMPSNIFDKLGLHELKSTRMCIQLAYRTIKLPKRIVENLLIKIGKLVFLVDFIVMDMYANSSVPIILGRPFLTTSWTLIDISKDTITLRANDKEFTFSLNH